MNSQTNTWTSSTFRLARVWKQWCVMADVGVSDEG